MKNSRKANIYSVFMAGAFFFAACTPSPSPPTETPPSAPATATIIPSPTPIPAPASFLSREAKLLEAGYHFEQIEFGEWALIHKESGQVLMQSLGGGLLLDFIDSVGVQRSYPQESFDVRETIAADIENVLTVKNPEGEIEYFYLEKTGYWVTPVDLQRNAEDIDQYTDVDIEADLWSGRIAITEALSAEEFPSGTLVPDGSFYNLTRGKGYDYNVILHDSINYIMDSADESRELINQNNDYRKWVAFYRTQTPEGKDAIIGTEQVLMSDGQTSLFLHYVFGPEWPWEENYTIPGNYALNLVESIFLAKTNPNNEDPGRGVGDLVFSEVRPVIHIAYGSFTGDIFSEFSGSDAKPVAGEELYQFEQNNPVTISPNLLSTIQKEEPNVVMDNRLGLIDWAGEEVNNLQYMGLTPARIINVSPNIYFNK